MSSYYPPNERLVSLERPSSDEIENLTNFRKIGRYAIADNSVNWADAQAQVKQIASAGAGGGKSSVVSLKSSAAPLKRKVMADGAVGGAGGDRQEDRKKTRRGGGGKKVKS